MSWFHNIFMEPFSENPQFRLCFIPLIERDTGSFVSAFMMSDFSYKKHGSLANGIARRAPRMVPYSILGDTVAGNHHIRDTHRSNNDDMCSFVWRVSSAYRKR